MGNPFNELKGLVRIAELIGEMDDDDFNEVTQKIGEVRDWLEDAPFDPEEVGAMMAQAHETVRQDLEESQADDIRIKVTDMRNQETGEIQGTIITVGDLMGEEDEIVVEDMDGAVHIDAPSLIEPEVIPIKHEYNNVRDVFKNGILTVHVEYVATTEDETSSDDDADDPGSPSRSRESGDLGPTGDDPDLSGGVKWKDESDDELEDAP